MSVYVFLTGKCPAAKFSLLCTTQYSSRAPYMKSSDKHMEPNQALWATAGRMKPWVVRGVFAWRGGRNKEREESRGR